MEAKIRSEIHVCSESGCILCAEIPKRRILEKTRVVRLLMPSSGGMGLKISISGGFKTWNILSSAYIFSELTQRAEARIRQRARALENAEVRLISSRPDMNRFDVVFMKCLETPHDEI